MSFVNLSLAINPQSDRLLHVQIPAPHPPQLTRPHRLHSLHFTRNITVFAELASSANRPVTVFARPHHLRAKCLPAVALRSRCVIDLSQCCCGENMHLLIAIRICSLMTTEHALYWLLVHLNERTCLRVCSYAISVSACTHSRLRRFRRT